MYRNISVNALTPSIFAKIVTQSPTYKTFVFSKGVINECNNDFAYFLTKINAYFMVRNYNMLFILIRKISVV